MKKRQLLTAASGLLLTVSSFALSYYPPKAGQCVIGHFQKVEVGSFTKIPDITTKYDVGFDSLEDANIGYDLKQPLPSGTTLIVPSRFILPDAPHKGVVINLPEMRVYYYDNTNHIIDTYPAGIGKVGWDTPLGKTLIVRKTVSPTWTPTMAVRKDFEGKYGFPLPDSFPPGPDNPLGDFAIRLGFTNILMHGTNDPSGVGSRVSAGCIRMFNNDIGKLFESVYVGSQVTIVDQPYKAGWQGNALYFEAHEPLDQKPGQFVGGYKKVINKALRHAPPGKVKINWKLAAQIAHLQMGVPEQIGGIVKSK